MASLSLFMMIEKENVGSVEQLKKLMNAGPRTSG
jgi:hypothetical protein